MLPKTIAAYFAAQNDHDIDGMLAGFAAEATVLDEGRERRGLASIREWIEETTSKYRPSVEVVDAVGTDGEIVVTALVSGTFAGSPARLRYAFALDGERQSISRLEIG